MESALGNLIMKNKENRKAQKRIGDMRKILYSTEKRSKRVPEKNEQ